MKSKVSITMPVLNGKRFIAEAIESIAAQTYRNYELIVIDDGSTDGTEACVRPYMGALDIKYIHHGQRQGIAPSMNDGVRHSSGDLIAFLDHDDAWLPDFLATQVDYLEAHPDVGMVHSDFQTTDVNGAVIEASVAQARHRTRPSGRVFKALFMDSFIVGNSVLIRKQCFDRLGMFDETLKWGDYHMWMRIARHYQVAYVPKVLTKYRQHPTQSTRNEVASQPDAESVGMQAIDKLLDLYPEVRTELGDAVIRKRKASLFFDLAYAWYEKAQFSSARVCLRRAIALWPQDRRCYILYAAVLLSPSQAAAARSLWRRLRGLPPAAHSPCDASA